MHSTRRARRLLAGAAIAGSLLVGAACGDDDDDDAASEVSSAVSEVASDVSEVASDASDAMDDEAGETVDVKAVDYAFEDLPESIEAGTKLTLHNDSEVEFHELVALRIPDDETRSVEELVELPEAEVASIFTEMPATVLVAMPGEDGMAVLGDGTIAEPGRYAIICSIPVGADPEEVAAEMEAAAGEEPELQGGPPHFTQGMFAELVVE